MTKIKKNKKSLDKNEKNWKKSFRKKRKNEIKIYKKLVQEKNR